MRKTRLFAACAAVLFFQSAFSQTQQQWAQTVHWDGFSHWSNYIMMVPAYMGPNALPVPEVGNGSTDNHNWISAGVQLHFSKDDHTQTIILNGNYCLVKDVISFHVSYIPAEFYNMSDTLKHERHVYYEFYYDHKARGDVILDMDIRLLKKWDPKILLSLHAGYRYPSSNGFGSARFTDNMGYYFNANAGKPLGKSGWKWIGMAGFYCWQIIKEDLRQDDAFLFGTGIEYEKNQWKLQSTVAGYLGYLENQGDKPLLFRASIEKKFGSSTASLRFQQGMQDFRYTTFEFGLKHYFDRKRKDK